ncbi:hypothetical protein Glove_114g53 [Diversispora epigaea]|uniref:Uncharacterized protein n=1 Tax=Diversispora epigaea TaxID=1348612 RepID=A0A397J519_9GLOM|nr:hypothetical protein Glove_114g53 [Diversispora epigaea]
MVAITPIFERGNAIPLTTGKVLLLQIIPCMVIPANHNEFFGTWILDTIVTIMTVTMTTTTTMTTTMMMATKMNGKWFGGYLVVFFVIICWDVMTERYYDGFIGLSFMLGRQKDIMTERYYDGFIENGRKILWRVYLVYVRMAERYYEKCKEFQVIENPEKVEYPPNEFIRKYYPSGSIHFIRISNNKFDRMQRYARRRDESILAKTGRINNQNVFLWTSGRISSADSY